MGIIKIHFGGIVWENTAAGTELPDSWFIHFFRNEIQDFFKTFSRPYHLFSRLSIYVKNIKTDDVKQQLNIKKETCFIQTKHS